MGDAIDQTAEKVTGKLFNAASTARLSRIGNMAIQNAANILRDFTSDCLRSDRQLRTEIAYRLTRNSFLRRLISSPDKEALTGIKST